MYRNVLITLSFVFIITIGLFFIAKITDKFDSKIQKAKLDYEELIINNNLNVGKYLNIKELMYVKNSKLIDIDELYSKTEDVNVVIYSFVNCYECNLNSLKNINSYINKDSLSIIYLVKDCDNVELVKRLYPEYSINMYLLPSSKRHLKCNEHICSHQDCKNTTGNEFETKNRPSYIRLNKDGIILKFCYLDNISKDLWDLFIK